MAGEEGADGQTLNLYYDHYKQTDEICRAVQKRRNEEYVVICVLIALLSLMSDGNSFVFVSLNQAIQNKLGIATAIEWPIMQTLTWALLTYAVIRYVQDSLYVERQYAYLAALEGSLGQSIGGRPFGREGEYYSRDYPAALNLIALFYKTVCPLLLVTLCIRHIVAEASMVANLVHYALDFSLCVVIITIAIAYFIAMHPAFACLMRKNRVVDSVAGCLEKLLRKV